MKKTSYVQSLVDSQGNIDEFRKIQASLCPVRKRGNDANDDRQGYGPPDNCRPYGPPEDCRYYGPCRDRGNGNDAFIYPCIPVINQAIGGLQLLPVPMNTDLPHCVLKIGDSGTTPTPSLTPCVNTGAGANVGFIGYFDGILFMCPECVDQIF